MAAEEGLDSLVHDVISRSASLKSAAALLRGAAEKDRRELLALMAEQARFLAERLAEYERSSRG